jgi:energy-coupling factor transporter ATP-binding protein EcfA2
VALARNPRLLLLDEPHAGLDAEGRAALDRILSGAAKAGRTVVVASHELDRVRGLASREVVLTAGQAHGTVPEPPAPPRPQAAVAAEHPPARAASHRSAR